MIVRAVGEDLWLFDQNDHAALCGAMARAWGVTPFAAPPARVRRAAEFHDNGWREWDPRPRLDPTTGHPHPYSRMPAEEYLGIWERGLRRAWEEGEEVGLLVSLHAMRFFASKQRPEDREFFAAQRRRQEEALSRLGAESIEPEALPEPYATWHEWIFLWDALSLFLCEGWKSPWMRTVPTAAGDVRELRVERRPGEHPGGSVSLEPFPFQEPLVLEVPARVIPLATYSSQEALDAAVRAAEQRTVRWVLAAGEG